jgi:hypothetical protein
VFCFFDFPAAPGLTVILDMLLSCLTGLLLTDCTPERAGAGLPPPLEERSPNVRDEGAALAGGLFSTLPWFIFPAAPFDVGGLSLTAEGLFSGLPAAPGVKGLSFGTELPRLTVPAAPDVGGLSLGVGVA